MEPQPELDFMSSVQKYFKELIFNLNHCPGQKIVNSPGAWALKLFMLLNLAQFGTLNWTRKILKLNTVQILQPSIHFYDLLPEIMISFITFATPLLLFKITIITLIIIIMDHFTKIILIITQQLKFALKYWNLPHSINFIYFCLIFYLHKRNCG